MIKVDLHMHTGEDPKDGLQYPATAMIDHAADLGFSAIAITLHEQVLEDQRVFDYAAEKGLLLIPGAEWCIEGRDVLIYNVTQRDIEQIRTFDALRAFRRERGNDVLVIAPHPYYPKSTSPGPVLEDNLDLFDAFEHAQIYLPWLNFNKRMLRVAKQHNKPIVANSDAHNLWMMGHHYTLVDSEPKISALFEAIRKGHIEWHSPPMSVWGCFRMFIFDPRERKPGEITASFS